MEVVVFCDLFFYSEDAIALMASTLFPHFSDQSPGFLSLGQKFFQP